MNEMHTRFTKLCMGAMFVATTFGCGSTQATDAREGVEMSEPRVIALAESDEYQRLLGGEGDSLILRSGRVALSLGESSGNHSTERYEELIVALSGEGELRAEGQEPIAFGVGRVAYVPPDTTHEVVCTSENGLRYIYVVAPTRPE